MNSRSIFAQNVELALAVSSMNATKFCELCNEHGIRLARSTLSRLLSGDGGVGLGVVSEISKGIRLLPNFDWAIDEHLISENFEDLVRSKILNESNCPKYILAQNLEVIMSKAGVNASKLSELSFEAGLTENPTSLKATLSRILNRESNVRMDSLILVWRSVRLLPEMSCFKFSQLFEDFNNRKDSVLQDDELERFVIAYLSKLNGIGWVTINKDINIIASAIHLTSIR